MILLLVNEIVISEKIMKNHDKKLKNFKSTKIKFSEYCNNKFKEFYQATQEMSSRKFKAK